MDMIFNKEELRNLWDLGWLSSKGKDKLIMDLLGEIEDLRPINKQALSHKRHSKCCDANIRITSQGIVCRDCHNVSETIDVQDY